MSADVITPAILEYLEHGAYPEDNSISSTNLSSDALANLLSALRDAQNEAKAEIRDLSKATASDIDPWISRAKGLQADILRARETARQVVAEADSGRELKLKAQEAENKAKLLEKEVAFNETLAGTLEHIKHANGLLNDVQDQAVKRNVEGALAKLHDAESAIGGLDSMENSRAVLLLRKRADQLRDNMIETTTEWWNTVVDVNQEEKNVIIKQDTAGGIGLESVATAAQGLGILHTLLQKLTKELERAIFRPRLFVDDKNQVARLSATEGRLECSGKTDDLSYERLFADMNHILRFLASYLPSSLSVPLSKTLIPAVISRLQEHWLAPAVPLEVDELSAFQTTLDNVIALADQIDSYEWDGAKALRDWVQGAPRIWLTKRREAVLGDVRNLVFSGLKERKIVERVETRMVDANDTLDTGTDGNGNKAGENEDWDTAWDDPEDKEPEGPQTSVPAGTIETEDDEDEDEANAWGADDEDERHEATEGGDEDAWGWGDDETKPDSPVVAKKSPAKVNGGSKPPARESSEREMTIRETFTVTGVAEGVLAIVKDIIHTAETLAGPAFASSPIAPAATALYTLPTLALAIYRATAPTAYTKLDTGNMLIYNDASHLASQLREWQASQPPASRLRLDNDVKALDSFAKRAYSSEMESQRTILRDLLDGAQGFSNATVQPYKTECESAIDQTAHRLRVVHQQWEDVLSQGALLQSLGSLFATVTGKMISEIEDLGDIGEADSHQLTRFCQTISEVKELFIQQKPLDSAESSEPTDMTFIYCPNWLKFQYLAEILESSLADIKYLWNEGELSLEFDAEEVVELIQALFAESDLRRRAIAEIRRGTRT
ncbi:Hypothetical protein R9X50_00395200 [Acrodontium crateriforme]|uniref:ZW10 C-terminal helical domain-containing protein n=1 Tax=Acrodontium crateriforme TaxID=150365 RepID=A0AAQ3M564_9PEZI|nr:Hypothetical protein R9X50_00395200 [Acrodontium crateriforme]